MDEEVFNVVVWFTNGESRVFGATETTIVSGYLFIKGHEGTTFRFNQEKVAGFSEPTNKGLRS